MATAAPPSIAEFEAGSPVLISKAEALPEVPFSLGLTDQNSAKQPLLIVREAENGVSCLGLGPLPPHLKIKVRREEGKMDIRWETSSVC